MSREFTDALPWKLLYADDLVTMAKSEEELIKKLNLWEDGMGDKDMKVNMNKTRVMISGESHNVVQNTERWPCAVCGKGVGRNSIQCTNCQKWVHLKCSGIKGSTIKVSKSFV